MNEEQPVLDRSFIGKEYRTEPKEASADDMMQYARATNETNPRYFDSGHLVPPPLYPVSFLPGILMQLVDDSEEMNLNILRVVHAEQEMWWRELIHPGDRILTTAKIVNIEQRGVNELIDIHIHCISEETTKVEMRYRLLMRGTKKGEKKPSTSSTPSDLGEKIAQRTILVTDDQGQRYAEASGDHNPIHISDEIARSVGLPSMILQGLCTMAFASQTIVEELLEGNPEKLRYMKVRFSKPVLMGQELITEVYECEPEEDGFNLAQFLTKNPSGVPVLTNGVARYSK
ncbi:MAG: MaoC/PaaZ C-terminal domain-containing protein [Candidatus Thorarchaeota archaeon]|jgi:acyl dehydratase